MKKKLKKNENITLLWKGKEIENSNIIKRPVWKHIKKKIFEVFNNDCKEIEKNIFQYQELILVIKWYGRSHTIGGKEESLRTRYTKKEVKNYRAMFETTKKNIIFCSSYDAGDKILMTLSDVSSLLYTKKANIISDSRINEMNYNELNNLYNSKKEYIEVFKNKNSIIPFYFGTTLKNLKKTLNSIISNEIIFPLVKLEKKDLIPDINEVWNLSSFNNLTKYHRESDKNKFIGELGEVLMFNVLGSKNKEIIWQSKLNSRSSYDFTCNYDFFWEVKSTISSGMYFISEPERIFMMENKDKWSLMRVFMNEFYYKSDFDKILLNFEEFSNWVNIQSKKINYSEYSSDYVNDNILSPVSYRVREQKWNS